MTDFFALLEQPRRPWLDPEAVQTSFVAHSHTTHPDHVPNPSAEEKEHANQRSAELNAARSCLRNPKERLAHLLELETSGKPAGIQEVPRDLVDLFAQVAQLTQKIDRFLQERSQVDSPLLKVAMFQRSMDHIEEINALLQPLKALLTELHASLQQMNPAWDTAPPPPAPDRIEHLPLAALQHAYQRLSYLNRWTSQLQNKVVQLSI